MRKFIDSQIKSKEERQVEKDASRAEREERKAVKAAEKAEKERQEGEECKDILAGRLLTGYRWDIVIGWRWSLRQ